MTTDKELRSEVLRALYEQRAIRGGHVLLPTPSLKDVDPDRLEMIGRTLKQHGLIEWKGHLNGGGIGRIIDRLAITVGDRKSCVTACLFKLMKFLTRAVVSAIAVRSRFPQRCARCNLASGHLWLGRNIVRPSLR